MSATGGSSGMMSSMFAAGDDDSRKSAVKANIFTSGITAIGTGISQSRALRAQGDYEESVANTNAKLADLHAKESLSAGDAEAGRKDEETKLRAGAARAAAGASGADVGSDSFSRGIKSIEDVGAADALTIKNNAARTAWGFQTQGIMDRYRGKMAQLTARSKSEQTLITGGLNAISGPMSIYNDYLKDEQRYGGKQATPSPPDEMKFETMV